MFCTLSRMIPVCFRTNRPESSKLFYNLSMCRTTFRNLNINRLSRWRIRVHASGFLASQASVPCYATGGLPPFATWSSGMLRIPSSHCAHSGRLTLRYARDRGLFLPNLHTLKVTLGHSESSNFIDILKSMPTLLTDWVWDLVMVMQNASRTGYCRHCR